MQTNEIRKPIKFLEGCESCRSKEMCRLVIQGNFIETDLDIIHKILINCPCIDCIVKPMCRRSCEKFYLDFQLKIMDALEITTSGVFHMKF